MAEYRSRSKKRPVFGVLLILFLVVLCPAAVLAGAFMAFEIGTAK